MPDKSTKKVFVICFLLLLIAVACGPAQPQAPAPPAPPPPAAPARVRTGAELLLRDWADSLAGRRIALAANHTARVGSSHLADSLLRLGLQLVRVFSPEHGFRGDADAGEKVGSSTDPHSGLPILSLYGDNKKPKPAQLQDLDLILFDMQDVGSRHYTYISTLAYLMEACAEADLEIWVLDRPNPLGDFVAGPVLEPGNASFIGMHPVPIVHGLTLGEYARAINGEGWLAGKGQARLRVIPCEGYRHAMRWQDTGLEWVPPSPNLGSPHAAQLYPALCWFEAAPVSVGRGTEAAFTLLGAPWRREGQALPGQLYGLQPRDTVFTPISLPGKAKTPPFQDQLCRGEAFGSAPAGDSLLLAGLSLLQGYYQLHQQARPGARFFDPAFYRWAGNKRLQGQIMQGLSPEAIAASWQPGLEAWKQKREKYRLYP